jgi:hypothetical protein
MLTFQSFPFKMSFSALNVDLQREGLVGYSVSFTRLLTKRGVWTIQGAQGVSRVREENSGHARRIQGMQGEPRVCEENPGCTKIQGAEENPGSPRGARRIQGA